MFGPLSAYLVAASAMLFSGISALVLIQTARHLDPPEIRSSPKDVAEVIAV